MSESPERTTLERGNKRAVSASLIGPAFGSTMDNSTLQAECVHSNATYRTHLGEAAASPALPAIREGGKMLRTSFAATILAGALAGSAVAQAPDAGCALPSEPEGIPAALDAAITGPADKDRACMKTLLIPEARMMFVSLGADGAPTYTLQTLDDWIAGAKASGHALLEEKQLKFHIERYGNVADLWSSYALRIDGKQVARGIHSIQAIKEAGGWRVTGIMVQAESATEPLPKKYLP
jgi:hypothetical protein